MIAKEDLVCPVCESRQWKTMGKRDYADSDVRWSKGYALTQSPVFFQHWHNSSRVTLERVLCGKCGFVSDAPRPDREDLLKKYGFLSDTEKKLGAMDGEDKAILKGEKKQSHIIQREINKWLAKSGPLDIMDYGGGDGHIVSPYAEKGHNAFLVDYNLFPVEGVTHLAKDLDGLDKDRRFDIIICRHVLEHVAEPGKLVREMSRFLKEGGVLFAEIPIELVAETTPREDPVTHINYFQEKSFALLFGNNGYDVLMSKKKHSRYHNKYRFVAQLVSRASTRDKEDNCRGCAAYSEKLMRTSMTAKRISRAVHDPSWLVKKIIK